VDGELLWREAPASKKKEDIRYDEDISRGGERLFTIWEDCLGQSREILKGSALRQSEKNKKCRTKERVEILRSIPKKHFYHGGEESPGRRD